jgi:hypothetical protein
MVGPPACGAQPLAASWPPQVPRLLAPRGEAFQRGPAWRAGGAALEVRFPLALRPPSARKPPQRDAGAPGSAVATARAQPRLGRRPRQADLLSPVPQHVVEAFCLCWSVDRADDLIRVADEARLPSTGLLDPCFHPEGQHGGQNHLARRGATVPPGGVPVAGWSPWPSVSSPPALSPG